MIGRSAYRILVYRKTIDRVSVAIATLVSGVIVTLVWLTTGVLEVQEDMSVPTMANKSNNHFNGFIFIFTLASLILSSARRQASPAHSTKRARCLTDEYPAVRGRVHASFLLHSTY
jgi:hypothetical protein